MDLEQMNLWTPGQLADLLDIDARVIWGEQDAASALRHQLTTPLMPDLAGLCRRVLELQTEYASNEHTFLKQLTTNHPDLDLLMGIKLFARQLVDEETSPLKGGPAGVLYFSAIARAHFCLQERISQLTNGRIREGCLWALKQNGAEDLRDALTEAGNCMG